MKDSSHSLVGPSSILLAMMASGMNGQVSLFMVICPSKRRKKASFKRMSFEKNQSQIFIETPYRNNKLLEDLIQILNQKLICASQTIYHCQQVY
jgi:16S rRNA (cytidine1402-2'-O)-methyltransferase